MDILKIKAQTQRAIDLFLAGPIAELRWRRNCRSAIWFYGPEMADRCFAIDAPEAISDLGQVRRRLAWSHPGAEMAAFNRAWLEAESRVAVHMHIIDWVGRLLSECGEPGGSDVHEMVERLRSTKIVTRHMS